MGRAGGNRLDRLLQRKIRIILILEQGNSKIRYFKNEKGSVAIMVALLLTTLISFAGLAIDVGFWYHTKRQLQLTADAGAIGGALAYNTKGASTIVTEATHDLILNGCTSAKKCTITGINNPPLSGPSMGDNKAVEVILSQPGTLFFWDC